MKIFDLALNGLVSPNIIVDELNKANYALAFIGNKKGDHKFLYTDLGEDEFNIASILMHRNIEVFNFFKLLLLYIEKFREQPHLSNDFSLKIFEYIRMGNLKKPTLNI